MQKWFFVMMMVFLMGMSSLHAQETADISPALQLQLEAIEGYVIQTRGLDLTAPLIRVFPNREQVEDFLIGSLEEQLTPDIVQEAVSFYAAFDFLDPQIDLVDVYLNLLKDQIGGYYDPEDKTMNTILLTGDELGDSLPSLEKIIYAHEFVHNLQDQAYDLNKLGFDPEISQSMPVDQLLAMQALVEGDATVMMNLYTEKLISDNPLAALGILTGSVAIGGGIPPAETPAILMQELLFPYNAGANFVTALVNEGGWAAVDNAFVNLPQSTEQILHVDRYRIGDVPITVTLDETDFIMGDDWTLSSQETLGEFYLRAYLSTQLETEMVRTAATGWGGDQYRIYQHAETDDYALVMRLTWDTPKDAEEFKATFMLFAQLRGNPIIQECSNGGTETFCMVIAANGDTIISRAPDIETAAALARSQS